MEIINIDGLLGSDRFDTDWKWFLVGGAHNMPIYLHKYGLLTYKADPINAPRTPTVMVSL